MASRIRQGPSPVPGTNRLRSEDLDKYGSWLLRQYYAIRDATVGQQGRFQTGLRFMAFHRLMMYLIAFAVNRDTTLVDTDGSIWFTAWHLPPEVGFNTVTDDGLQPLPITGLEFKPSNVIVESGLASLGFVLRDGFNLPRGKAAADQIKAKARKRFSGRIYYTLTAPDGRIHRQLVVPELLDNGRLTFGMYPATEEYDRDNQLSRIIPVPKIDPNNAKVDPASVSLLAIATNSVATATELSKEEGSWSFNGVVKYRSAFSNGPELLDRIGLNPGIFLYDTINRYIWPVIDNFLQVQQTIESMIVGLDQKGNPVTLEQAIAQDIPPRARAPGDLNLDNSVVQEILSYESMQASPLPISLEEEEQQLVQDIAEQNEIEAEIANGDELLAQLTGLLRQHNHLTVENPETRQVVDMVSAILVEKSEAATESVRVENEMNTLQSQLDSAIKEAKNHADIANQLDVILTELRAKLERADEWKIRAAEQIAKDVASLADYDSLLNEKATLEDLLRRANEKVDDLTNQLAAAAQQVEDANNQLVTANANASDLQKRAEKAEKDLRRKRKQFNDLQARFNTLEGDIKTKSEEVVGTAAERDKSNEDAASWRSAQEEALERITILEASEILLKDQVASLNRAKVNASESQKATINQQLDNLKILNNSLSDDLRATKTNFLVAETEAKNAQTLLEEAERKLSAKIDEYRKLKNASDESLETIRELEREQSKNQEEYKRMLAELNQFKDTNRRLTTEKKAAETTIKTLQAEIDDIKSKSPDVSSELADLERRLRESERLNAVVAAEKTALLDAADEADKLYNTQLAELSAVKRERDRTVQDLEVSRANIDGLTKQISDLTRANEALRKTNADLNAELQRLKNNADYTVPKGFESVRNPGSARDIIEGQKKIADLQTRLTSSENRIQQLTEAGLTRNEEFNRLSAANITIKADLDLAKKTNDALIKAQNTLKADLVRLQKSYDDASRELGRAKADALAKQNALLNEASRLASIPTPVTRSTIPDPQLAEKDRRIADLQSEIRRNAERYEREKRDLEASQTGTVHQSVVAIEQGKVAFLDAEVKRLQVERDRAIAQAAEAVAARRSSEIDEANIKSLEDSLRQMNDALVLNEASLISRILEAIASQEVERNRKVLEAAESQKKIDERSARIATNPYLAPRAQLGTVQPSRVPIVPQTISPQTIVPQTIVPQTIAPAPRAEPSRVPAQPPGSVIPAVQPPVQNAIFSGLSAIRGAGEIVRSILVNTNVRGMNPVRVQ